MRVCERSPNRFLKIQIREGAVLIPLNTSSVKLGLNSGNFTVSSLQACYLCKHSKCQSPSWHLGGYSAHACTLLCWDGVLSQDVFVLLCLSSLCPTRDPHQSNREGKIAFAPQQYGHQEKALACLPSSKLSWLLILQVTHCNFISQVNM